VYCFNITGVTKIKNKIMKTIIPTSKSYSRSSKTSEVRSYS